MEAGYFVFTSNVDGHFQKAGFPENRVVECHGSINYLQSTQRHSDIWPVPGDFVLDVDEETLCARDPLPRGPPNVPEHKRVLARPNILMFGDYGWVSRREEEQEVRMNTWLKAVWGEKTGITVIEIGSSPFVPTVRNLGETISMRHADSVLVRINPRDSAVRWSKDIRIPMGGLEALQKIDALVDDLKP